MTRGSWMRTTVAGLFAALIGSSTTLCWALAPTVAWQTTDGGLGVFSGDGSSILITTPTGFRMRRTSNGAIEKTITLPAGYTGYDRMAFSPDKKYVATTVRANGITRIDLWRVSDGALERTINTDATRNNKSLDFSSTGLIEAHERYAYGGGGYLRVFRVSDGSLVAKLGPYARNSTPEALFSPNGSYLAVRDHYAGGVRVLRSADWGTALTVSSPAGLVEWAPDSQTLWTSGSLSWPYPWQEIAVPSAAVVQSALIDESQYYVSSFTPDGRFFLATGPSGNKVDIRRISDLGAAVSYTVKTGVYAGTFNPQGTHFWYGICDSVCTLYVAVTPAL